MEITNLLEFTSRTELRQWLYEKKEGFDILLEIFLFGLHNMRLFLLNFHFPLCHFIKKSPLSAIPVPKRCGLFCHQ